MIADSATSIAIIGALSWAWVWFLLTRRHHKQRGMNMPHTAEFTLYVEVQNASDLLEAGKAKAIEEGVSEADWAEWVEARGIGVALVMLLDPGSLPGCSIMDSSVEEGEYTSA